MNRQFSILSLIILSTLIFSLPSCRKEKKYKIGVSQCANDAWRTKMNDEIMREVLFHDNIEVEIRSADDSNEKQLADLRHFASGDYDLIIAAPNEASALTPIIDSIYSAGIPVIIMDRGTTNDHYTAFQGADNFGIGSAAANYALTLSSSPQVIELLGNMRTTPAQDRRDGFHLIADKHAGFDILASANADWTLERGRTVTDSLLNLYPQANIIYAHNDNMAIGASQAARHRGRNDIKIIGIDASPHIGMQAVKDSIIDATFVYPTEGRQIISTAISILENKPFAKNLIIPSNTAVNLSNAEIMLDQEEALKVETDNIKELKSKLDVYWKQHHTQSLFLYGLGLILLLTFGLLFLLLRYYWAAKRHRDQINAMLLKVEQASQSKLTFFTSVSHDLRTPLSLIATPVELLADAPNLTPQQKNLVRLADKYVRVLKRLINQVLDFRKYDEGKLHLNLSEANLATDLTDWTEGFSEIARKRHIRFSVNLPENQDGITLAYDREKLEGIIFNLLSNAFKFSPDNSRISLSLSVNDKDVCISVADNGNGIPQDEINRIFDYFYKTDTLNPQGSGIGLALCKAFVKLHGGSISVQSTPDHGTLFTFSIPIRHVDTSESLKPSSDFSELDSPVQPEVEPSDAERSVLVIDDNPDLRTLIASMLSDRFKVIQASDGSQGIRLATKFVPDLIICDVMMPGIDGFETCRRIKAETSTSHIPVLLLTACTLDEQKSEGYDCGADAYLTKPFSASLLNSRIDALLKNRELLHNAFQRSLDPSSHFVSSISSLNSAVSDHKTADTTKKGSNKNDSSYTILPSNADTIDNMFYSKFMDIVKNRLADSELSVDNIASEMGLSRVQLYRKLKALTNYSPTDLLRICRLKTAEQILKTSDTTVAEVCYNVGFSSHSYFTKCYREYFGESPTDTRKRVMRQ